MAEIKVGDLAPQFTAETMQQPISLSDYKGKKVVLYFYPKDSTPGCTAQACSLRDGYEELTEKGYVVIGVSPDSKESHIKFSTKQSLPFILVADTDQVVSNLYGVWRLKKFMGREKMGIVRTTFIIDEQGKIERIITKVNTKAHAEQILEEI